MTKTVDVHRSINGLETPYPSSPSVLPKYVLRCTNMNTGRMYLTNFVGRYAAKKTIDLMTAGCPEPSIGSDHVVFGHIRIASPDIAEVMAHRYTDAEATFEIPSNIASAILRFSRVVDIGFGQDQIGAPVEIPTKIQHKVIPDKPLGRASRAPVPPIPTDMSTPKPKTSSSLSPVKPRPSVRQGSVDELGDKVTELTVKEGVFSPKALERLARANDVWKDDYAKLSNGLMRMTVVNRLRAIDKKGGDVKW